METEEIPYDAAASTERKHKRKKTDPVAIIDGKQLKRQLLNNNTFSTLANENEAHSSKSKPVVSIPGTPGAKKQPPLVVKNVDFTTLAGKIESCDAKLSYKITRFGTKIHCASDDDVTKVRKVLEQCGFEYYTHDKPSDRPYRVVLRGLPLVAPEVLLHRLKLEHKLDAQAAHIIKRKGECAALDEAFYLIHFAKGSTTLLKLREIKQIGQIIVRWEAYRNKRADVTQCMNCLYHGHGTRNCHLKSRCNNCGDNHSTEKCPSKEASTKRCANCCGAHPATDRSCPKRAEYQHIRQQTTTKNHPGQKVVNKRAVAPAFTPDNFPALPNKPVAAEEPKFVNPRTTINTGTIHRHIDPRTRAGVNQSAPPVDTSPEVGKEELYSSAELWAIFTEFRGRMLRCKTKSDQVDVLGYMVCKYGVN